MEEGQEQVDESMMEAFKTFDKDGSGSISSDELKMVTEGESLTLESNIFVQCICVKQDTCVTVSNKGIC